MAIHQRDPLRTNEILSIQELVQSVQSHVSESGRFSRFQRAYENDRVAFAMDMLPVYKKSIADYQLEVLGHFDDGYTRVAVRSPHGTGKTFLAAILIHHTVLTSRVDCKVPTTASAWRQLEKYLWPEAKKLASTLAWGLIGRDPYDPRTEFLTQSIRLRSGLVEAFALASDDHVLIEGAHATRMMYVFDEAKSIPVPTWDAAEGAFSNEDIDDIRAFAISTPGSPSGRFYDIHMGRPGYEDWKTRHITLDEAIRAGRIGASWADRRKRQWGESSSSYQNRVLGEFCDDSEEGIIPKSWVLKAQERWKDWARRGKPSIGGRRTLGVDVAREGSDLTALALRNASVITEILTFPKSPTTVTAGRVKRYGKGRYINIEMDGGLGASVYDMLREDGWTNLRPITVAAKTFIKDRSGELGFLNVRAAMWWKLREMLDPAMGDEIALPPIPQLEDDLVTPRYFETRSGLIQLEPKKSIAARIGRSTDYGDSVCLAFWKATTGGGVVA